MQRKFKFRVWDTQEKIFICKNFHFFGEVVMSDIIYQHCSKFCGEKDPLLRLNDLIVQQYIGLKDKNNEEIYEGDIVTFKANFCSIERNGWKTGEIIYEYDGFKILVENDYYNIYDETDEFESKSEILGNIFMKDFCKIKLKNDINSLL